MRRPTSPGRENGSEAGDPGPTNDSDEAPAPSSSDAVAPSALPPDAPSEIAAAGDVATVAPFAAHGPQGEDENGALMRWLLEGNPQRMDAPYEYEEEGQH